MSLYWDRRIAARSYDENRTMSLEVGAFLDLVLDQFTRQKGWDWAPSAEATRNARVCDDCGVPILPEEFCYYLGSVPFENDDQDEEDVSVWCCLECAVDWVVCNRSLDPDTFSKILFPPAILTDPERNPWTTKKS